jgi:hypothetical protein
VSKIKKILICNHSHTDIGFTDYQDVCFRQHAEFVEQALDLIEKTDNFPVEAKYKWTVETTGPFIEYLKNAKASEIDRFIKWYKKGRIDVAGMQYNFTPLLNIEQMIRSLYPVKILKNEYGVDINSAMQDDVNGVSWVFAELLSMIGIDFFTIAVNPIRGARVKPFPGAFNWQGPSNRSILAWNGFHYLFGRSQVGFGNTEFTKKLLPRFLDKLETDNSYNYDFLYCESTHPIRVDNGPPDERMPNFVKSWNENNEIKMEFVTVSEFGNKLKSKYSESLPTLRGDWTDHWTDGPGSSSYETGLNRKTHELLLSYETTESILKTFEKSGWDSNKVSSIYENMTLYDEHTWGSYSSIQMPESLFSKAIWNKKAWYAYNSAMETHDLIAKSSNKFAKLIADPLYDSTSETADQKVEGNFNLGDHEESVAYPDTNLNELLVINTLPFEREIIIEEPEPRWGLAPVGILDTFFDRGASWGGLRPAAPIRKIFTTLPALGYKFVDVSKNTEETDLVANKNIIENKYYKIVVNNENGNIEEFFDKELKYNFASKFSGHGFGDYVYEEVESKEGRLAINNFDFSHEDFFIGLKDAPYIRSTPDKVMIKDSVIENDEVKIEINIEAKGIRRGSCIIFLQKNIKALNVHWHIDKKPVNDPESVFFAFPINLENYKFNLDLNGINSEPNKDQLKGSSKDWYPFHRYVNVSDGSKGITMASLDAPLLNLGGITSGKWTGAGDLEPEGPHLYSWAINNHWMVNFKSSQEGKIPFRFRFQTHSHDFDIPSSFQFGLDSLSPPIILRDKKRKSEKIQETFISCDSKFINFTLKPSEDSKAIILRAQNLTTKECFCTFSTTFKIKNINITNILENLISEIKNNNNEFKLSFIGNEIKTLKIIL